MPNTSGYGSYERHDDTKDFEVLPLVTCKTFWGSAPNGDRDIPDCTITFNSQEFLSQKFRYIEIAGSLKDKAENKCSKRCTYEGPNLFLLPLWGCCDGESDSALEC
jgi:hypothetical protein